MNRPPVTKTGHPAAACSVKANTQPPASHRQVSDLELLEKAIASKQCTSFGGKQVNSRGAAAPADAGGPIGMAMGSRAHLESAALAKRSRLRNFLMHGFHALVTFVAGHEVRDTQCGFKASAGAGRAAWAAPRARPAACFGRPRPGWGRTPDGALGDGAAPSTPRPGRRLTPAPPRRPPQLFTRRAAAAVFSNQRLQRWCFDVELVYLAQRLGVPISGAPPGVCGPPRTSARALAAAGAFCCAAPGVRARMFSARECRVLGRRRGAALPWTRCPPCPAFVPQRSR
jgi:hypothetical protein